jgi:putative ABC transport system ATP-binding protein
VTTTGDFPAIEARDLYRFYHAGDDEVLALRGVSLTVRCGEFVAVMGPSGSGKSTLLACLAGLDEPDGGAVFVAGTRVTRRPEGERAALRAQGVGVVLQGANLVEHLTVASNLRLAGRLADRRARADVEGLLGRVGLADRAGAHPAQLSGGEAVRAAVALALVNEPSVVVADEPTAEIDGTNEQHLLDLLRAEADRGVALVVATHSPVVAGRADRVVSLADGRVLA